MIVRRFFRVVGVITAVAATTLAAACVKVAAECPPNVITVVHSNDAGDTGDGGVVITDGSERVELPVHTDGGAEPFDTVGAYAVPSCAAACANLARLRCPEGKGRPGEDSCYVVCKRAVGTHGRIDLKPNCVAAARSAAAVRACDTYRCLGVP